MLVYCITITIIISSCVDLRNEKITHFGQGAPALIGLGRTKWKLQKYPIGMGPIWLDLVERMLLVRASVRQGIRSNHRMKNGTDRDLAQGCWGDGRSPLASRYLRLLPWNRLTLCTRTSEVMKNIDALSLVPQIIINQEVGCFGGWLAWGCQTVCWTWH